MSKRSPDNAASQSKRRSLFFRSPLSGTSDTIQTSYERPSSSKGLPNQLRKKRTPPVNSPPPQHSSSNSISHSIPEDETEEAPRRPLRPSLTLWTSRPSSFLGSLKSYRSMDDADEEALTTTSSRTFSEILGEGQDRPSMHVLHHGEVQTSSSLFRKRREYLVLTDTHLLKLKSQQKASEMFTLIPANPPTFHRSSATRHVSTPSSGSLQDHHSFTSDTLERESRMPLKQIIAVYQMDDGAPSYGIEVDYLDEADNHAMSYTLRFTEDDERNIWLRAIRSAAAAAMLTEADPVSPYNLQMVARAVESDCDYDSAQFAVYKIVHRASKTNAHSSYDDLTKDGSVVSFLAIGIHKLHIIPLPKKTHGVSTPQTIGTITPTAHRSYGIMNFILMQLSEQDDSFDVYFRVPFQRYKEFNFASLAAREISARLKLVEERLRPEWESRPYTIQDPSRSRADSMHVENPHSLDVDSFDRTLTAYCVAYNVRPDRIRYFVNEFVEDAPRFELLPPASITRSHYNELELLAIFRSLRYNESFVSISFAYIPLDGLNDVYDEHGFEHVCFRTKRGTTINISEKELASARLLVQEIRAIAVTTRRLRRLDFTSCIQRIPQNSIEGGKVRDQGCGISEALFPLCKLQVTNVDWLVLSGIQLGETDLDYIGDALVDRSCHFRALEMSDCALTDRSLALLLDTLRAQDGTMEALDISRNPARLSPSTFSSQLGIFGFLRRLNLSQLSRTSDSDSLINLDTLMAWRLEELNLSGTSINHATLDVICRYVISAKSDLLRELRLDHCYLSSKDMAQIMRAVARHSGGMPLLHVDLSQNEIEKDRFYIVDAIREGLTPHILTICLMEYQDESHFRALIQALTVNPTITHLDISRTSLPSEVSEETSVALERLFSSNLSLQYLDISGEDSRLESSKLGAGLSRALSALSTNTTLQYLKIQHQNLGLQGAHALADVVRTNKHLRELHCENNSIPLSGLMDMVNALEMNTTLHYLSGAEDSKREAQQMAEMQIKALQDESAKREPYQITPTPKQSSIRSKFASTVIRGQRGAKQKSSEHPHRRSKLMQVEEALDAINDLDKVWNKQAQRLEGLLYRNQNLAINDSAPAALQAGTGSELKTTKPDFNRNSSSMTIEKILASVDADATPRIEREVFLADGSIAGLAANGAEDDALGISLVSKERFEISEPPSAVALELEQSSSTVSATVPKLEESQPEVDVDLLADIQAALQLGNIEPEQA